MTSLFRVQNPKTMVGLWYDKEGNYNPFIKKLSNAKCRDLPMGFDPNMVLGGLAWHSATDSLDELKNWIPMQDMIELAQAGYEIHQVNVSDYRQVPGHVVYTPAQVIETIVLDINLLVGY